MRMPLMLAVLLTISCSRPAAETQPTSSSATPDANPVVAALTHFHGLTGLWSPHTWVSGSFLVVDNSYEPKKGLISASQLDGEHRNETWRVPEDARLDMERRTDAKEAVQTGGFPDFCRVGDLADAATRLLNFEERYPDAKGFVRLWPTGYTRDGNRSVVRFGFGPTPHGACATYLLELRDSLWHVTHHRLSYYV